jgi:hypothetical protein
MDLTFHPRFDCAVCPTRCDGRSKSAYVFEDDMALMTIGNRYRDHRTRRRASTDSDYVDGEYRGVTVNDLISLEDLLPLEKLLPQMAER